MADRNHFDVFIKYPLQTLALLLGSSAFTAGTGMLRYGNLEIALAFGALAS